MRQPNHEDEPWQSQQLAHRTQCTVDVLTPGVTKFPGMWAVNKPNSAMEPTEST